MKQSDPPAEKRRAQARRAFYQLLARETKHSEWRDLFSRHPDVLASSSRLLVHMDRVVPIANPAQAEPDLIVYAHGGESETRYGVLELVAEDPAPVPQTRHAVLVEDIQAAIEECEDMELAPRHANRDVLCLGNSEYLFLILELKQEACDALEQDLANDEALLEHIPMLTYADVAALFSAKVAPQIVVLAPTQQSLEPSRDPRAILDVLRDRNLQKSSRCG